MTRLIALERLDAPGRFRLPVERPICVGPPGNVFLFGGLSLGAALTALEAFTGRPALTASVQFLSAIRAGETLDLALETPLPGRNVTQARAVGRVGEREIFTVLAALGGHGEDFSHQWAAAPDVPAPEACAPARFWPYGQAEGGLTERLEMRLPAGPRGELTPSGEVQESSRRVFWLRTREDMPIDACLLAMFADFVPYALASALGGGLGGTSLDNTLRIRRVVQTPWVLCDARIHGAGARIAHGDIRLYAQTGELMAIGSQSMNVWLPKART